MFADGIMPFKFYRIPLAFAELEKKKLKAGKQNKASLCLLLDNFAES
jgi:hypothetical protein